VAGQGASSRYEANSNVQNMGNPFNFRKSNFLREKTKSIF